ncbi:MAG: DUF4382 domain-containing protein [Gammaproteobacteria bacterium]|nr:DUF4382 domain-containing protein [Gammaproteobacteria bacterium]
MKVVLNILTALLLCGSLAACGTDSGSSDQSGNTLVSGGGPTFTLRVTDAPIDDVVSVVLSFTEVRLRNTNGNWTTHTFNTPKSIDMLQLQGTNTADLLVDKLVDVGNYDEIRLLVDAAPMANYIQDSGGMQELMIPSGSSSGLKIKGNFSVLENRPASLVMDLDLRQSITVAGNSGNYILKPVVRLVNVQDVGHIRGTVDAASLDSMPACSDTNPNTFNAVYVYAGHNITPDDIDQSPPQSFAPYATTSIAYDNAIIGYLYEAAFLPAGDYTIAFTCNADAEDLDDGNDDLKFFDMRNVTVLANNTLFL